MNKRITSLFIGVCENKVELVNTNLSKFCDELNRIEPESRNYAYYSRVFKKSDVVEFENGNGKKYYLQKIES